MQKARNLLLTAIAALIFLSVALNFAAQAVIPEYTIPEFSVLEGRSFQSAESLAEESISDGSFQTSFESFISDHVPQRDMVVSANATMQRASIQLANVFAGYACYPTYYGSNRIYVEAADAVAYIPSKKSADIDDCLRAFSQGVANLAKRYPDKNFAIYLVGACSTPDISPAYELVNDSFDNDYVADILAQGCATASNVRVFTDSYESLESYYQANWRTDHHWNSLGAALACNNMASYLGWTPFTNLELKEVYSEGFMGRLATTGLYMLIEPALDLNMDFSGLTITEAGTGKRYSGDDHFTFWNLNDNRRLLEFNAEWYRSTETSKIEGQGKGNAVLVTDSFGSGIQMLVASHYQTTTIPWSLYADYSGNDVLADKLDDSVKDVIFVADYTNYVTFNSRFPHYFD